MTPHTIAAWIAETEPVYTLRNECIQNECGHTPATTVVHLNGLDDFCCEACFIANYRDNEACLLAWESESLVDSQCEGFGCVDTCSDCTPAEETRAPSATPCCVWCSSPAHAPGKCPLAAEMTGKTPWQQGEDARKEIAKLRNDLAALTKAADLAYDALDWQLESWDADTDGTPPSDLLNAHATLYGLLRYAQHPEENTNELPF